MSYGKPMPEAIWYALLHHNTTWFLSIMNNNSYKKMLRGMQTLRAGCSKVEPKIFALS